MDILYYIYKSISFFSNQNISIMEISANLIKTYQEEIHIASGKIGHLREIVNREKDYFRDEPKIFYFSNDNTNKREKNIR